jgi:esterase/lipase superfamily enzyme
LPFAVASALFVLAVVGCCWQAAASLLFTPSAVMRVYGNERGELETGVCEVTIPKSHQRGQLESASLLRLELKQDAARHIVLQSVIPKERTEFLAELSAAVARSPQRDVLIFIHGYNVDFEDAARRTAQLAKDLELQGAPVCYSWPSQAGLLQYAVDETNVVWTVPHLKQFLLEVVRESDARSVNVIAHSMGNRALTSALKELRYELQDDARLFNQVVLAAPDIDADIFRRDIAPAITSTARRVTLYASSKDRALAVSKRLHGYPRAGESGPSLLLVEDIDTIDASGIDFSLLGHSYYGGNSNILADLGLLIRQGLPAASRMNLAANRRDGLTYWVFKGVATAGLTGSEEHRR